MSQPVIEKTRQAISHIGPIEDLEQHVKPDWWCRLFNSIYLKTDADVVNDADITAHEVTKFTGILDLPADARILDLCCGQGRHLFELGRRGFRHLYGLDRSRYLIKKARAAAKKELAPIQFKEGDARRLGYPADMFDAVMILGNSFGYFETVEDDLRVLKEVHRVLKPCGRILIDVADGAYLAAHFQARSWEWVDKKHFVCRERSLARDGERLITREVVTHVEKGVLVDQFYAERLYTEASLTMLFQKADFSPLTLHGAIDTVSSRNQDLGMMEKRLILTAGVRKDWSPVHRLGAKVKQVAVLLGDPQRPDPLKPDGSFDEDDFFTIHQLKSALHSLKEFEFSFLDNHATLIGDLMKSRGKYDLVFNLCDEGFGNDARQELHVPAFLEMLDIPYTGGGPQCLAFCYDKSLVRGIAGEMGIPVPDAFLIESDEMIFDLSIHFPVIVKPNFGDSSFGITRESVAANIEDLNNAIVRIRRQYGYDKPIIVEEFLPGADLSLGIIGNPPETYTVLPVIEEDYSALPKDLPRICGYEAKWLPDSPYWQITSAKAALDEATEKLIEDCCLKLFHRLECRDYCRFDWRLDASGSPKLLEVNPNPGWCWDGHLFKMTRINGGNYADMLRAILGAASERCGLNV